MRIAYKIPKQITSARCVFPHVFACGPLRRLIIDQRVRFKYRWNQYVLEKSFKRGRDALCDTLAHFEKEPQDWASTTGLPWDFCITQVWNHRFAYRWWFCLLHASAETNVLWYVCNWEHFNLRPIKVFNRKIQVLPN